MIAFLRQRCEVPPAESVGGCSSSLSQRCRRCVRAPVTPRALAHGEVAVWAISDLHCDHDANLRWTLALQRPAQPASACHVLLVAGDVSDDVATLRTSLTHLAGVFDHVWFVPGNHELWVRGTEGRNAGARDSEEKLHVVLALCSELGVHTSPGQLGNLWVVPVLSWHHQSWDQEADIPGMPKANQLTVSDYASCRWPAHVPGGAALGSEALAEWFDGANERLGGADGSWSQLWRSWQRTTPGDDGGGAPPDCGAGTRSDARSGGAAAAAPAAAAAAPAAAGAPMCSSGPHMITLSHFLPHQELLPEKRYLLFPNLAKAVGSVPLRKRLQRLDPDIHIFGHSHFAWDMRVAGTRFIQAPLCYPAERRVRQRSIVVDDSAWDAWPRPQPAAAPPPGVAPPTSSSPGERHAGPPHHAHASERVSWLPVLVWRAAWEAEAATADGGAPPPSRQLLMHEGVAVVATEGHAPPDPGHGPHPPPLAPTAPSHFRITRWAATSCPPLGALWSEHYASPGVRNPDDVQLAPWVLQRYSKYKRFSARLAAHQAAAAAEPRAAGRAQPEPL